MTNLEQEINNYLSATPMDHHGTHKLDQMLNLIAGIGSPQEKLKVIHIAGTSGKTSTSYFIAAILRAAGHTAGLTVSPHIDTIRERAMVNLTPLPEQEWRTHLQEFFKIVKSIKLPASYFEFYMAFAYWLFAKLGLEYAVIETGLGGKWDGSNVVTRPDKICVITDIGLDHIEILGDTLPVITAEKAAIIKQDNAVFINVQSPEVLKVIKKQAKSTQSDLHILTAAPTKNFLDRNFYLAQHAATAALKRDHFPAPTSAQLAAARGITVPARAEKITYKGKTIIMDGSHNPQKLQAFIDYLVATHPAPSRTLIATFGANKIATLNASMRLLRQLSDHIILTSFQNTDLETDRRASIDQPTLIKAAKAAGFKTITSEPDDQKALALAVTLPPDQIVITGSFYLLAHLRPYLHH